MVLDVFPRTDTAGLVWGCYSGLALSATDSSPAHSLALAFRTRFDLWLTRCALLVECAVIYPIGGRELEKYRIALSAWATAVSFAGCTIRKQ